MGIGDIRRIMCLAAVLGLVGALSGNAQADSVSFYGVSERGGYFYELTYDTDAGLSAQYIKRLDTNSYGYYYGAMDLNAAGEPVVVRGTGGSSTGAATLYRLTGTGFTATAINDGTNSLGGMATTAHAGLAYTPDGKVMVGTGLRYVNGANRSAVFGLQATPTATMDYWWYNAASYNAPYIQGLQYYNGKVYALAGGAPGTTTPLHLFEFLPGDSSGDQWTIGEQIDAGGFTFTNTAGTVYTYNQLSKGDLALVGDTMFAMVSNRLYAYDMGGGSGSDWMELGSVPWTTHTVFGTTYSYPLTGLVALPDQEFAMFGSAGVPEPLTMLALFMGLGGVSAYLRRRRA